MVYSFAACEKLLCVDRNGKLRQVTSIRIPNRLDFHPISSLNTILVVLIKRACFASIPCGFVSFHIRFQFLLKKILIKPRRYQMLRFMFLSASLFSQCFRDKQIDWSQLMTILLTHDSLSSPHTQTDSEVACEEAAKLTADYQGVDDSPDDDEINYNELPPPPGEWTGLQFCCGKIQLHTSTPQMVDTAGSLSLRASCVTWLLMVSRTRSACSSQTSARTWAKAKEQSLGLEVFSAACTWQLVRSIQSSSSTAPKRFLLNRSCGVGSCQQVRLSSCLHCWKYHGECCVRAQHIQH